ncbi:ATP-binding protein, partial [Cryobacterium sp. 1639]|nr:ATP-binding protein [Cryobacterium sp. 1639]
MSRLDGETKRKLREMNAGELLEAIDTQDEMLSIGLPFEDRMRLAVDDAYSTFTHSKVAGLIRRAGL